MLNIKETKIVEVETTVKYETDEVDRILAQMIASFRAKDNVAAMYLFANRKLAEDFFKETLTDTGLYMSKCWCYTDGDNFVDFNDLPETLTNSVFEYFFTRFCKEVGYNKGW